MNKYVLSTLAVAVGAASLNAQIDISNRAGVGRITAGPIDADTGAGTNGNLGVAMIGNQIFTSSRWANGTSAPPHSITVWDYDVTTGAATVNTQYTQDVGTSTSAWGYRDGCTDGTSLIFGFEGGTINVINPADGTLVNTVVTANSPGGAAVVNPIIITAGPSSPVVTTPPNTARGIAYDPNGNGGNGSIFVGDFASDIIEIDLNGTIIQSYPQGGASGANLNSWSTYGLTLDTNPPNSPTDPGLWINAAPDSAEIREYKVARDPLGAGDLIEVPGRVLASVGGIQGGLATASFALDGRGFGSDVIHMQQGTPDLVYGRRVNLFDAAGSDQDLVLETQLGAADTFDAGVKRYRALSGNDLTYRITDPTGTAVATAVLITFGNSAVAPPLVDAGFTLDNGLLDISLYENNIPVITNGANTITLVGTGGVAGIPSSALDMAIGLDLVGQGLGIVPANLGPQGLPNQPGAVLGAFGLPLQASNLVGTELLPPPTVVVSATGANSFNGDTTSGFFKVENFSTTGDSITQVIFDMSTATNGNQTMVFDTDQGGMADTFQGGNSAVAGCLGTYRNGSEAATGLVFAGTNVPTCDPAGLAGWLGANPGAAQVVPNFQQVTFDFTTFGAGLAFEFDADTDGGNGINGAAMADIEITVMMSSGTMFNGRLVALSADSSAVEFF